LIRLRRSFNTWRLKARILQQYIKKETDFRHLLEEIGKCLQNEEGNNARAIVFTLKMCYTRIEAREREDLDSNP
jgi:hypothetical protein